MKATPHHRAQHLTLAQRLAARGYSLRNRPRLRPMPRQLQPDMVRLAYFAALRRLVREAHAALQRRLAPLLARVPKADAARQDQDLGRPPLPMEVQEAVRQAAQDVMGRLPNARLEAMARKAGEATDAHNRRQLRHQFAQTLGIDVLESEPALRPQVEAFTRANVALIRTVPQRLFAQVEAEMVEALRSGARAETLQRILVERVGVAESRAALIARDQVGKLYGDLNRVRQEGLGVRSFVWRSVRDNRVRREHVRLNGQRFEWARPPAGEGIPGQAINCRCWADPDIEAALEALPPTPQEELGGKVARPSSKVPRNAPARAAKLPKPKAPPLPVDEVAQVAAASTKLARQRLEAQVQAATAAQQAHAQRVASQVATAEVEVARLRQQLEEARAAGRSTWQLERALQAKQREVAAAQARLQRTGAGEEAAQRLREWEELQREAAGPVRGTEAARVQAHYPRAAAALGGRLQVDAWTPEVQEQLAELEALPPTMLAALRPHLGQVHIAANSIRGHGRWQKLEDKGGATSYDARTSWDQVGGVCSMSGPGRAEVVNASWRGKGVMAHELSHALDNMVAEEGKQAASEGPAFQQLWRRFKEGKDLVPGQRAAFHKATDYFTNDVVGHMETFAEAHAQYLAPTQFTPAMLAAVTGVLPPAAAAALAGKSHGYQTCAYLFGRGIADYVEQRVKEGRWLRP